MKNMQNVINSSLPAMYFITDSGSLFIIILMTLVYCRRNRMMIITATFLAISKSKSCFLSLLYSNSDGIEYAFWG